WQDADAKDGVGDRHRARLAFGQRMIIHCQTQQQDQRRTGQRAAQQPRPRQRLLRFMVRAPVRHHPGVETKWHFRRRLRRRQTGHFGQTIPKFRFHRYSSIILANCFRSFIRARNARTLMSEAFQPVRCLISSTERSSRSRRVRIRRSLGTSVSNILCASSRAAILSEGSGSLAVVATLSITSAWASSKSAQRNSGRHFSARSALRQVLTATRDTQCSKGTLPEYWSRCAKILPNTI